MSTLLGATARQLQTLARTYQLTAGKAVLDIGCAQGEWVTELRRLGATAIGLDDVAAGIQPREHLFQGCVAASFPIAPQSQDVVVIRGTTLLQQTANSPEVLIGTANILSALKPGGLLLIAVASMDPGVWTQRLAPFRVSAQPRQLGTGLLDWLTLGPILRPGSGITVLEARLSTEPVSRLGWHRLAREAVMGQRMSPPAAA